MRDCASHRAEEAGVRIASAACKHEELVRGDAARCRLGTGRWCCAGDGVQELRLRRCSSIEAEQAQRGLRDRCEDGFCDRGGAESGKAGSDEASSIKVLLGCVVCVVIFGDRKGSQVCVVEGESSKAHAQPDRFVRWCRSKYRSCMLCVPAKGVNAAQV